MVVSIVPANAEYTKASSLLSFCNAVVHPDSIQNAQQTPIFHNGCVGYATSALLALNAIQRDPYVPAKGSQLVSRFTQEKIDAADVAAVSAVTLYLKGAG